MSGGLKFGKHQPYDVIVCGAGHAGCEAALASSRLGADTLMLTGNLDTIAQMSCNPAIGGQAKGHMVREIDALGGEMAINTDTTAIQFRLLNASKGPAVQAPTRAVRQESLSVSDEACDRAAGESRSLSGDGSGADLRRRSRGWRADESRYRFLWRKR